MKYAFGLCKGRHEIPVKDFIFDEIADPTDFEGMAKWANDVIPLDATEIEVYVTGLTPAMLAVSRICFGGKIDLTAMNYDRESGKYLPQTVMKWKRCPFCGSPVHGNDTYCGKCGSN